MGEWWFRLVLATLATWRLATLLVHEDGPWDATLRLRRALGNGQFGRMLDCFRCVSLWMAAPLAFTVGRGPLEWILAWLALSGAACLLERVGGSAVAITPLDKEGDPDELLWTEARSPGDAGAQATGSRTSGRGGTAGAMH